MTSYLLVDGGQSGCRVVYVEDGEWVGSGDGIGVSRQVRERSEGLSAALEHALAELSPRPEAVDVVAAGLTGFDDSPEAAGTIATSIRSLVRAGRVILTNDAVTSYLGAIGPVPGAIVAAGTGVIALVGDTGRGFARSDGWGYMLGDDGGGYYIGRRGLASALRAWDGRGGSEVLKHKAKRGIGSPVEIKRYVYESPNPVSRVAEFAVRVAEAAREGDPIAAGIWADAATELSSTADAALLQLFEPGSTVTVSWTGSLFKAEDLLLNPFKYHLLEAWPSARLLPPVGGALRGAELLAGSERLRMFGSLIHVFDG